MCDDNVSLSIEKHGFLDLLIKFDLSYKLLAGIPNFDTTVSTWGENESLLVKNVHSFEGLFMLVYFLSLDPVKFLLCLLPLKEFEVTRSEAKDQSVVP